jgi:hypothetical protein
MKRRISTSGIPLGITVVLLLGALERVAIVLGYTPAIMTYPDAWAYVTAASDSVFVEDPLRPAGYSAFLAGLHAAWGELTFTLVVQHLLGLGTACLAFFAMRQLGAPEGIALVPAGCYALLPDYSYFEHSLLSETLFIFLIVGAIYALTRALGTTVQGATAWLFLGAAGVLVGASATVRTAALFAIPVVLMFAVFAPTGGWRHRLLAGATVALAVVGTITVYLALQRTTVDFVGLSKGGNRALYSRVAPLADCREFSPPRGTEALCESSDWRLRQGPDWYAWYPESPARRVFGLPPSGDDLLGKFARAAILGQPDRYIRAVAKDLWRYVDPDVGYDRPHSGSGPDAMNLDLRSPSAEETVRGVVEPYYGQQGPIRIRQSVEVLADIQRIFRIHGLITLVASLFALLGVILLRGRDRLNVLLLAGVPVSVMVMSAATTTYNDRYATPLLPLLLAAGLVSGWALTRRATSGRRRRRAAA